jgi:hypothetical protein
MTAANDPLARVQAMVDAWREGELFDTFDTTASEVSPPKPLENRGVGHFRQFRHHRSTDVGTRDQSADDVYLQEAHEQEGDSRVSYSDGVESVESVENARNDRKDSGLIFDTSSPQMSKNEGQVSKKGLQAGPRTPATGIDAPAGVPAAWVEGVARLAEMPCPVRFPAPRWALVVSDAEAFLDSWAAVAHRLGWPAWELFGCHGRAPWGRIQGMGLVLLLKGNEIAAMTQCEVVIRTGTGARQTYRRKPTDPLHPAERCLVWELQDA